MKFIFTFIFFLSINSINLYSQYDFKYIGNVNIIRDNKKINLDNSKKLFDKDRNGRRRIFRSKNK